MHPLLNQAEIVKVSLDSSQRGDHEGDDQQLPPQGVQVTPFYQDFAHVEGVDTLVSNPSSANPRLDFTFPVKLHCMLEYDGLAGIVGWEVHGRSV